MTDRRTPVEPLGDSLSVDTPLSEPSGSYGEREGVMDSGVEGLSGVRG